MSLAYVEARGRCPRMKGRLRCVLIAQHQSAPCRFHDPYAEMLWQAIADLMGMLPVRYHTGDPANVRTIERPSHPSAPRGDERK